MEGHMKQNNVFQQYNMAYEDRFTKMTIALQALNVGASKGVTIYDGYLQKVSSFMLEMIELEKQLDEAYFTKKSFEELKKLNHHYFEDIQGIHYEKSYANPEVAQKAFGQEIGQILAAVYFEIRTFVGLAFEHRTASMTLIGEKFLKVSEVLNGSHMTSISNEGSTAHTEAILSSLKTIATNYALSDLATKQEMSLVRRFAPDFVVYSGIVLHSDLSDLRYLFKYGMYISDNEILSARYLENLPHDTVALMADVYTQAFVRGFKRDNKPLETKKTVNVAYQIGFERVIRMAIHNFQAIGLEPLVYYDVEGSPRPRIINTKPSKQLEYDHRFDDAIYLSKEVTDATLLIYKETLEKFKEQLAVMAGPAVMETFGELPFSPKSCVEAIKYNEEQSALKNEANALFGQLFNSYLPRSEWSFTINTYPLPEIGKDYAAIFDETIKVNTLEVGKYETIQQTIINALDLATYVEVKGMNGNRTNLQVGLSPIEDSKTQTNFNNCTADVNVPVGEVFTSPRLSGTNGTLHVKEVYLFDLKYENLEIEFVEGMTEKFTCTNFDTEDENVHFVHENLIHPHAKLPLGEFAIGTNTTAYVMAEKYKIGKILPILIGEKTGPHFAIGDTCYSWSEDNTVYNVDGKEIVAKDNACSILRKEDTAKAYFYKHTDITIPYSELGEITAVTTEGNRIPIILNGRFVLPGTEHLNDPFNE